MKKNKLIIFDMDGVLVDACEWHKEALNAALLEISNTFIPDEEHYCTYNGLPTRVKLKMLAEKQLINLDDIEKIENLKQQKTIEIIKNKCNLRQEKIELLNYLKTNNILIGCYTNSIKETAHLMLEKTGIVDKFDIIITNQDVQRSKPDPEGYNKIIKKFNLNINEVLIVEDSPKGIEAASKTGANLCIVKNPDEVNLILLRKYI